MQTSLWTSQDNTIPFERPIDATLEIGAYEALWTAQDTSFKSLAERFAKASGTRPSDLVPEDEARSLAALVIVKLRERTGARFDVRLRGEFEYPERLRDATHPVELLYFQGDWDLASSRLVAVVGTRHPTAEGIARTRALVRKLVEDDFTIVSGLAAGIDTVAHETALEAGGRTIAVIGTPLGQAYPKTNRALQDRIARDFLVISQVPVERYDRQSIQLNRFFFPERNKLMAALTPATVIVEAGKTSGTLIQAREALRHNRKLLILNSNFERPELTWPSRLLAKGAIRINDYADIRRELEG